jgi:hypothetical protein
MAIFYALWALAHLALGLGYCAAGLWPWTALVAASAAAWLAGRRRVPGACLALSAAAAAAGALLSAPVPAMVAGAAAALAAWDVSTAGLEAAGGAAAPRAAARTALLRYARSRMPIALGAIGAGAAIAILGSGLRLRTPFWIMTLLVVVLILAIDRTIRILRKKEG